MPTNPLSLQARLDAMVREADKNVYGHAEDCRLRECGDSCSCGLVEQNIALDLLRQLDERDAQLAESEAKVKELEAKLAEVQKLHKRDYNRSWAAKREAEIVSLKAEWNIMRREGYQAAMILAHNLCAQVSDEHDADDEILQRNGASNCTYRIKGWLNPSDNEIMQLVAESEPARDALAREASRKKGAEHGE